MSFLTTLSKRSLKSVTFWGSLFGRLFRESMGIPLFINFRSKSRQFRVQFGTSFWRPGSHPLPDYANLPYSPGGPLLLLKSHVFRPFSDVQFRPFSIHPSRSLWSSILVQNRPKKVVKMRSLFGRQTKDLARVSSRKSVQKRSKSVKKGPKKGGSTDREPMSTNGFFTFFENAKTRKCRMWGGVCLLDTP